VPAAIDLLTEVLVHGVVAAAVVQLLIRRLPITSPALRLNYRVFALALPLVLAPGLHLLAPFRSNDWFSDVAVFTSARWQRFAVAGIGLRDLGFWTFALLGLLLLLPDVIRLVTYWRRDRTAVREHAPAGDEAVVRLQDQVTAIARDMGVKAPRLLVFDTPAAVLHCRGILVPTIVAARGVADRLSPDQLRAAIAHELAHVRRRDVVHSWILLALRLAQWFNPVAQVVGRRAVQEMEWEADRVAARVTGEPLAIARALVSTARARDTEFLGLLGRSRISAVEERCERLLTLDQAAPEPGPASWRPDLALTGLGLGALLFFVR
jgi:Zn-dependent protease with chaperone function